MKIPEDDYTSSVYSGNDIRISYSINDSNVTPLQLTSTFVLSMFKIEGKRVFSTSWNVYRSWNNIKDLELIEEGIATDEMILDALPQNNPRWWCKVEDGYILNLLGEKKNKEPYKHNS